MMVGVEEVQARGGEIRLGQLLQVGGFADSGGEAKALLATGVITVNGEPETRRGRRLGPGDVVSDGNASVRVT